MSGLINSIERHLDRPGKRIAIVELPDVYEEFEDVFSFVARFRNFTSEDWDVKLLQNETDNYRGNFIVLATYSRKIRGENGTGKRVYLVESSNELHSALKYDQIEP